MRGSKSSSDPWAKHEYEGPFQTNDDRRQFVFRVYMILLVAIGFLTIIVFSLNCCNDDIIEFFDDFWWLTFVFWGVFIIIYISFVCCYSVRHSYPCNVISFILMVVCLSMSLAITASFYELIIIGYAFITTTGIFALLTLAVKCIPIDFTKWGWVIAIISLIFFFISLICTILALVLRLGIISVVVAGLGVFVVSLWILLDTKSILGGKYQLEEDEYLLGAIHLFIDFVYLINYLLIIFGFGVDTD